MSSEEQFRNEFRRACSRWATGVVVVTTFADDGSPHGFTASSFTSVSLRPPLVSVALDRKAGVHPHFRNAKAFAINILSEEQQELSVRFATWDYEERYAGISWRVGEVGTPLLDGALAHLECTVWKQIEAGDHTLLIGRARRAVGLDGQPLLYFSGGYRKLAIT